MHGDLRKSTYGYQVFFLLNLFFLILTNRVFADSRKSEKRCSDIIQAGILNNLIATDRLREQLPGVAEASLDFIKRDFDRTKKIVDDLTVRGKFVSPSILEQVMQRVDVTQPVPGKKGSLQGQSDLLDSLKRSRRKMGLEEEKTALTLSDMGYNVKFNDGHISGERMVREGLNPARIPDIEINGKIFDIYSPQALNPAIAVAGVIHKIEKKQTHRVVVNLSKSKDVKKDLEEMATQLRRSNPEGLHEVLVIHQMDGASQLSRIFP